MIPDPSEYIAQAEEMTYMKERGKTYRLTKDIVIPQDKMFFEHPNNKGKLKASVILDYENEFILFVAIDIDKMGSVNPGIDKWFEENRNHVFKEDFLHELSKKCCIPFNEIDYECERYILLLIKTFNIKTSDLAEMVADLTTGNHKLHKWSLREALEATYHDLILKVTDVNEDIKMNPGRVCVFPVPKVEEADEWI